MAKAGKGLTLSGCKELAEVPAKLKVARAIAEECKCWGWVKCGTRLQDNTR